jgi:hypothetical protein
VPSNTDYRLRVRPKFKAETPTRPPFSTCEKGAAGLRLAAAFLPPPLPKKPLCIKCGGKMRFSCIEEEKPGFVHHVYECKKCRSTQSFVTPT